MKKAIALVMVCGFALAFASCGGGAKQSDEAAQDTTAMKQDTTMTDTTKTDTTQMK